VALVGIFMREPDLVVRVRAAHTVGHINCGETYAAELLQILKEDQSPKTVGIIVQAMVNSGKSRFSKPLQVLLQHPDYDTRITAAQQLIRVAPKPAIASAQRSPCT
jgi:HEAT repeat protein